MNNRLSETVSVQSIFFLKCITGKNGVNVSEVMKKYILFLLSSVKLKCKIVVKIKQSEMLLMEIQ